MRFWVYNLKGCFRFKLDIQFASDFIPQKKMNTVHMFPKRWWKQTKHAFSVFRGKANLALALPGALIYQNIYQQEWQVYDQTGIWTKYELSKPHCYIIRPPFEVDNLYKNCLHFNISYDFDILYKLHIA